MKTEIALLAAISATISASAIPMGQPTFNLLGISVSLNQIQTELDLIIFDPRPGTDNHFAQPYPTASYYDIRSVSDGVTIVIDIDWDGELGHVDVQVGPWSYVASGDVVPDSGMFDSGNNLFRLRYSRPYRSTPDSGQTLALLGAGMGALALFRRGTLAANDSLSG